MRKKGRNCVAVESENKKQNVDATGLKPRQLAQRSADFFREFEIFKNN